ncbi:MAG: hypothetical protein ACE5KM_12995 [Planctomycetaceae bacterium]
MAARKMDLKSVFDDAREIKSKNQRQQWLDRVCAGRPELQHQVEALLKAYEDAGDFLENPPPGLSGSDEPGDGR